MVLWKIILLISLRAMVNVNGKPVSETVTTQTPWFMIMTQPIPQQNETIESVVADVKKLPNHDELLRNNDKQHEMENNVKIIKNKFSRDMELLNDETLQGGNDDSEIEKRSAGDTNIINIGQNGTFAPNASVNLISNGSQYNTNYHINQLHNLQVFAQGHDIKNSSMPTNGYSNNGQQQLGFMANSNSSDMIWISDSSMSSGGYLIPRQQFFQYGNQHLMTFPNKYPENVHQQTTSQPKPGIVVNMEFKDI